MKRYTAILALIGMLLLFAGCENDPAPSADPTDTANTTESTTASTVETAEATTVPTTEPTTDDLPILQGECFAVWYRSGKGYSYQITDRNGNVLLSEDDVRSEPHIEQVSEDVVGVWRQAGTGRSTNLAQYCNINTGALSEVFYYMVGAAGNYVVYVNYEDGQHSVVVQHIFDGTAYYCEYVLSDASPVAADVHVELQFTDEDTALFTYLTGENFDEKTIILDIPAE